MDSRAQASPGADSTPAEGGRCLARANSRVHQSGIRGWADVTGLTIVFAVTSHPVLVTAVLPQLGSSRSGTIAASITDEHGTPTATTRVSIPSSGAVYPVTVEEEIEVPGTYTRKVQVGTVAGRGTLFNNAAPEEAAVTSRLRAVELAS